MLSGFMAPGSVNSPYRKTTETTEKSGRSRTPNECPLWVENRHSLFDQQDENGGTMAAVVTATIELNC